MKIKTAENCGFCFGVQNAVNLAAAAAEENPGKKVYTLGKLIHNETVTQRLAARGILRADSPVDAEPGSVVVIRSHGVGKDVFGELEKRNVKIVDATCPFVKKIQDTVKAYHEKGFQIVILGQADHPEVTGINGWCENSAVIADSVEAAGQIPSKGRVCVVAQTTFPVDKYRLIIKKIQKQLGKSVEIFDTICYTTYTRQNEAAKISLESDAVLVLGSAASSNTAKLYEICKANCVRSYLISSAYDLNKITLKASDRVGIVAGASTPPELIGEVKDLMANKFESEIQNPEFKEAMEESLVSLREGKHVKGTVIAADDKGISVNIGQKKDGYIAAEEACLGEYNPAEFIAGAAVEAVVLSTKSAESGCILLSKKRVDAVKEGDKQVALIRGGEVFELKIEKDTKGGLLSRMGTYTVFIPASHVREREPFVRDLKQYIGKTMRLTALEIDDEKRKIVASAKKVLEEERKAREEIFWQNVMPDVIVNGKVKRITNFGAFVAVDGFDCLAHIVDISWNHIKSADEILKVGKSYDFLVLSVDRERGRVSLSYKLLQPHPFDAFIQKHPIGSVAKGKVTSIVPFGAFVEIEPGIEGLVHVSEAAHSYVKNISEVVKAGEEIDVMILNVDPNTKKINLSIKACKQDEAPEIREPAVGSKERGGDAPSSKADREAKTAKTKKKSAIENDGIGTEWSDEASNNPFAELLLGIKVDKE